MEADWSEIGRLPYPGSASSNQPAAVAVTTFAFDNEQELLWIGNSLGYVKSFYSTELQKYTAYHAHINTAPRGAPSNAPVHQFLFCEKGILSVSTHSVHLALRNGPALWHLTHPDFVDLRCMSFTGRKATSEIIVAGCQRHLFRIDIEKGIISEVITSASPVAYTLMRRAGATICAASNDGAIQLLDSTTLKLIHGWKAYAGSVNDLDARGDYLLTCGWAQQQYQGLGLERLVRVYDLKNQRPCPPIPFPPGAAFVRLHPRLSSTCIVVSQSGVIHSIDVQNADVPVVRYANGAFDASLTGLELASSGKGFVLNESTNHLVLWGSPSKMQFTEYPRPTMFANATPPQGMIKHLDWDGDTPLNMIGMPHYREPLLSNWPNSLIHEVGAPPVRFDPALIASLRSTEYGLVGPYSSKGRRYQTANTRVSQRGYEPFVAPKFLSDRARDETGEHDTARRLSEDINKTLNQLSIEGSATKDELFYYRPPEIKYSKFGVDDFDFRYFNKTSYSGLETHIVNSYANPLLQILRFTNVARNIALRHTALDCQTDDCLLCELGFLIDMLEKAQGQNCQASNFLKALTRQAGANALNILEEHTSDTPLTQMMQNLNRFLLNRLEENDRSLTGQTSPILTAFGVSGSAYIQCTHCGYEDAKNQVWTSMDLIYPSKPTKVTPRPMQPYFSKVLKDSVERYDHQRGWCMRCQSYKTIRSRRAVRKMPTILMLNAAIHSTEARSAWASPGFLPREIGIIVHQGQFYCYEGQDLQLHLQRRTYDIVVYELVGYVADVAAGESQKSHMVAIVDVGVAHPDPTQSGRWHLVNDFLVRPISADEAVLFDTRWKLPSVLTYQIKSASHNIDDSWKSAINFDILHRSVTQPAFRPAYNCRALLPEEPLPGPDMHCAIDAEFIRLLREEIDVGADGSRQITRPARSGLARVSVLRGDGIDEELPFIDDYIAIDEPVDDYLTQYSGLHPGDLSVGVSRFVLVSLKVVYKKLWVLLNLGCRFIGHGLSSDFRTINIHVPDAQVIDTQDLYSLKRYGSHRKLSLRFLAWVVLREEIQHDSIMGHDSIEDARTALKLWRKYLEYSSAGVLDQILDEVWIKGKAMDFRVPTDLSRRTGLGGGGGVVTGLETPGSSVPGTPARQPANVVRISTPSGPVRLADIASPLKHIK